MDYIRYFPLAALVFNFLSYVCCQFEIRKVVYFNGQLNESILNQSFLSFVSKNLFRFQLFEIVSIFFTILTYLSLYLLIKQKFLVPEYQFQKMVFKGNNCVAVVVVVSQFLMTFIPSQMNKNKYIIIVSNFKGTFEGFYSFYVNLKGIF